jgi:serine protease Do
MVAARRRLQDASRQTTRSAGANSTVSDYSSAPDQDSRPFAPTLAPPAPPPVPATAAPPIPRGAGPPLTRVLLLLTLLLMLQYVVPYILERYQYAVTRGRQRAEYEAAVQGLRDLNLDGLSKAYQLVSQRVAPSVVHINVLASRQRDLPNEFAQLFGPQQRELMGQGSGVIMDHEGHVVTNFHVVHGAARVEVSLSDGRVLPARVVGADPLTDLAVLKIPGNNLSPAEWGDSEALDVGALVWAAGSPFGLQSTITSGIVSAKHRAGMAGEVYQDFLQTDAAVNPGNSGGPLVDAHGRVVGINTAILGDAYQGVSFAIPSSVAKEVFQRLKTKGQIARGWLGVQLRDVRDEDVQQRGLPDNRGALISAVIDDPRLPSPALEAGLQTGDVVLRWNGKPIAKPAELIRLVAMTEVGSTATIDVWRDGHELRLKVKIAERPPL